MKEDAVGAVAPHTAPAIQKQSDTGNHKFMSNTPSQLLEFTWGLQSVILRQTNAMFLGTLHKQSACHAGGRGFESRPLRHLRAAASKKTPDV